MIEIGVIVSLLVFLVAIQAFHMMQVNKLIDKLMSRNYYDYQISQAVTKPRTEVKQQEVQPQAAPDFIESLDSIM